jgi:hypothetical protein
VAIQHASGDLSTEALPVVRVPDFTGSKSRTGTPARARAGPAGEHPPAIPGESESDSATGNGKSAGTGTGELSKSRTGPWDSRPHSVSGRPPCAHAVCQWRVLRVPRQYIGTQTGLQY